MVVAGSSGEPATVTAGWARPEMEELVYTRHPDNRYDLSLPDHHIHGAYRPLTNGESVYYVRAAKAYNNIILAGHWTALKVFP